MTGQFDVPMDATTRAIYVHVVTYRMAVNALLAELTQTGHLPTRTGQVTAGAYAILPDHHAILVYQEIDSACRAVSTHLPGTCESTPGEWATAAADIMRAYPMVTDGAVAAITHHLERIIEGTATK